MALQDKLNYFMFSFAKRFASESVYQCSYPRIE
jgi:hypothetical protein